MSQDETTATTLSCVKSARSMYVYIASSPCRMRLSHTTEMCLGPGLALTSSEDFSILFSVEQNGPADLPFHLFFSGSKDLCPTCPDPTRFRNTTNRQRYFGTGSRMIGHDL